jgi:hypothetical protein
MEMKICRHVPTALFSVKNPVLPTDEKSEWVTELVERQRRTEKPAIPPRIEFRSSGFPTRNQITAPGGSLSSTDFHQNKYAFIKKEKLFVGNF